jgi:hypothetical protein
MREHSSAMTPVAATNDNARMRGSTVMATLLTPNSL